MKNEHSTNPENTSSSIKNLIIIDDDFNSYPHQILYFGEIKGLKIRLLGPEDLKNISEQELLGDTIVIADQFNFKNSDKRVATEFLDRLKSVNPNLSVIEASFTPREPIYKGSIYVTHTTEIFDWIKEDLPELLKQPDNLFPWMRYHFNHGFLRAQNSGKYPFDEVRNLFDKLFGNPNFNKLCELLEVNRNELDDGIRYQKDIQKYREAIHLSWMVLGHLSINNGEEFYGLPLQRLKEIIKSQQSLEES